ncbi:MAG: hypothetical protein HY958_06055 [Bacteroidia bacterium]|nr:hypothetical protein [Bacteroidia bacterium]
MDEEPEDIILDLELKITEIITLNEKFKKENLILIGEKNKLLTELETKTKTVEKLKKKIDILQISKSLQVSGEDVHDARIKINRIVREIDNCIALLNR